jgi:hypothetical protein
MASSSGESRPDTPTSMEFWIEQQGGTTSAVSLLPDRMQRAKCQSSQEQFNALVHEASCLRAESKFLRQMRNAAILQHAANLDELTIFHESPERIIDALNQIYMEFLTMLEMAGHVGNSTFQNFANAFEVLRTQFARLQMSAETIEYSTIAYSRRMRRIEEGWMKCFDNKDNNKF